ncbi:MAG: TIGR01212 family radical SAM protein [Marinilabiliales bacterium]|nr:MAG: TIGR01212 family radical SAM protein [Marinilabiliales bacterium]
MIYPWGHKRRFNAYSEYFRSTFGHRVQKLSIDAGFSCPNRDGTVGTGGCTYCNSEAFNPSYCQPHKSVTQQLNEGIEFHSKRYRRTDQYLAYFQPYSNTHAPLQHLQKLYEEALHTPGIVGLVIGTRPDCVDERKLDYLAKLSEENYVIVEYGIESCYDKTLKRINRGHTFADTVRALEETAQRGIKTGGHMIFGLPGETPGMMMSEASVLSELPLDTVKFHQLQIVKDTIMAEEYINRPEEFKLFELDEYLQHMADFLTLLRPDIVIERIAGEVPPAFLLEPPRWKIRYDQVLQKLEKLMMEQDLWQGKSYKNKM